jgi:hypothetical protein
MAARLAALMADAPEAEDELEDDAQPATASVAASAKAANAGTRLIMGPHYYAGS